MKTRIITAVVGLLLVAVVLVFYETIYFNLVFALVCIVAIHEVFDAYGFKNKDIDIFIMFSVMALLVMLSDNAKVAQLIIPALFTFLVYLAVCVIFRVQRVNFAKLAGMLVFSAIILFCFYSLIYLKAVLPKAQFGYAATYFVLLILAYAWGGDTCAYFAGRAFGKRKLAPVVSPKKTVEGAVGGVLGAVLIGLGITAGYMGLFGRLLHFTPGQMGKYYLALLGLGVVASLLGIIGDLFASSIKRQCQIKDFGTIFPGHGGILDRFDSVLFVAPLLSIMVTVLISKT